MIASSSSVPPADFLRLALLATGACVLGRLLGVGVVAALRRGLLRFRLFGVRLLLGLGVGLGLGFDRGLAGGVGPSGHGLLGRVQQPRLDGLVRAQVAALADAGALADAAAQVVELGPADVAAGGHLDLLDLRRVHREGALDADAEALLAHGEGLADPVALALDDDALEDLRTATRALDDLEMHAHAVAGLEPRDPPKLRAFEAFDDAAHDGW